MTNTCWFHSGIRFAKPLRAYGLCVVAAWALVGAWAQDAVATPFVYQEAFGGGGSGDFMVGYSFSTSRTIIISNLGKFDYGTDGLSEAAQVGVWDGATLLTSVSVPSGTGTLKDGGARFASIAPYTLAPGSYVIGAQAFAGGEAFAYSSTVRAMPGVTYGTALFNSGNTFLRPTTTDPTVGYFGPSMRFSYPNTITVTSYSYPGSNPGDQPSIFLDNQGGTNQELTNGIEPNTPDFNDVQWVGFQDPALNGGISHPLIQFNLGQAHNLSTVLISYLHDSANASGTITAPESVYVSTSNDGVNFGAATQFTGFDSTAGTQLRFNELNLTGLSGQYVRLDFRQTSQWTFLSEVSFTGTLVPEPSSFAMLLFGSIALYFFRRK